ncbi:MAG: hypothetical protein Q9216_002511 [Gyalolechia sp. 2 TL-2023]
MVPAIVPKLYAVDMQHNIEGEGDEVKFLRQSRAASEKSSYTKKHELFLPEQSTLSTTTPHNNALPTNKHMVYVATGILISFLGLAVTGHAIKRKLQYRAKLKTEQPAHRADQHNLVLGQINDYIILDEPESTPDPDPDLRAYPWYQRVWQMVRVIFSSSEWKKCFLKPPPENGRMVPGLSVAEKKNNPRTSQRRQGTKAEERTDLPVRIMPPASAIPSRLTDGGASDSALLDDNNTKYKARSHPGGAVEGSSTAQRIPSPRIAATRRSNRSVSSA